MAHSKLYIKIMNSAEWRRVRSAAIGAQPLCAVCLSRGKVTAARCVHHIVPVESAKTEQEAWDLALRPANLQPLCFDCHAETHKAERSHSKQAHQQRTRDRLEQWKARRKSFEQILTENEDVLARLKQGGPPDPDFFREGEKPPNPLALPSVET